MSNKPETRRYKNISIFSRNIDNILKSYSDIINKDNELSEIYSLLKKKLIDGRTNKHTTNPTHFHIFFKSMVNEITTVDGFWRVVFILWRNHIKTFIDIKFEVYSSDTQHVCQQEKSKFSHIPQITLTQPLLWSDELYDSNNTVIRVYLEQLGYDDPKEQDTIIKIEKKLVGCMNLRSTYTHTIPGKTSDVEIVSKNIKDTFPDLTKWYSGNKLSDFDINQPELSEYKTYLQYLISHDIASKHLKCPASNNSNSQPFDKIYKQLFEISPKDDEYILLTTIEELCGGYLELIYQTNLNNKANICKQKIEKMFIDIKQHYITMFSTSNDMYSSIIDKLNNVTLQWGESNVKSTDIKPSLLLGIIKKHNTFHFALGHAKTQQYEQMKTCISNKCAHGCLTDMPMTVKAITPSAFYMPKLEKVIVPLSFSNSKLCDIDKNEQISMQSWGRIGHIIGHEIAHSFVEMEECKEHVIYKQLTKSNNSNNSTDVEDLCDVYSYCAIMNINDENNRKTIADGFASMWETNTCETVLKMYQAKDSHSTGKKRIESCVNTYDGYKSKVALDVVVN